MMVNLSLSLYSRKYYVAQLYNGCASFIFFVTKYPLIVSMDTKTESHTDKFAGLEYTHWICLTKTDNMFISFI